MAVFDTPISTDAAGLSKITNQSLPVLLYLFENDAAAQDETLRDLADDYSGDILVAKVNVKENPEVHSQYESLPLPAVITLDRGAVQSKAGRVRPQDIEEHADFLMGQGPMPTHTAAEVEARTASGAAPIHITDAMFEGTVLENDLPVLIDFWAPWCGPCHMIAPSLERLAQKYAGQIVVAKMNVDENPQTPSRFGVRGIPMLALMKQSELVGTLVGAQPEVNIEQFIQKAI